LTPARDVDGSRREAGVASAASVSLAPTPDAADAHARLVAAIARQLSGESNSKRVEILETHISTVLLTGRHAYKLKKPVDLGFLDFTTLAARRHFCEQELRLNRRLAPSIYLSVVPITGTVDAPVMGGTGEAIDYAVQMREFPQDALLSRILARGLLAPADVDALAGEVARFHARIDVAPPASPFGSPETIAKYARQNFMACDGSASARRALASLSRWTESELTQRAATMRRRKAEGFVRECHGDLHLGNMAEIDGRIVIFDCIEFNDELRWIDVMSEVAFTAMDLADRQRADLARRFLNAYLERTGDYAGLSVLRFYLVYRAMVRAKVAQVRADQVGVGAASAGLRAESRGYIVQALRYARRAQPMLVVMHGFSGSGKTTVAQDLLERLDAIRIRTDVERKRMPGVTSEPAGAAAVPGALYTSGATTRTYERVRDHAAIALDAGFSAIADGTFLRRAQRDLLRGLAAERRVPFVIVDVSADSATLRERLARRARASNDASDADAEVLALQLRTHEPLGPDEMAHVVACTSGQPFDLAQIARIRAAASRPSR
jgi:hypothetical protein